MECAKSRFSLDFQVELYLRIESVFLRRSCLKLAVRQDLSTSPLMVAPASKAVGEKETYDAANIADIMYPPTVIMLLSNKAFFPWVDLSSLTTRLASSLEMNTPPTIIIAAKIYLKM